MNRRPSTSRAPSSANNGGVDKLNKRHFPSIRRHYQQPEIVTTTPIARPWPLSSRFWIVLGILFVIVFWRALTRSTPAHLYPRIPLRDQPPYDTLLEKRHCTATVCDVFGQCTQWEPHREDHEASIMQGVVDNVATIELDLGCELLVKVANGTWMTLSHGTTDCRQQGCQDIVDIDLRGDLYTMVSQLKQIMDDPVYKNQEVVVSYMGDQVVNTTLDVTLISQFSVNRLDVFTQVLDAWPGPISIAIYLTEPDHAIELKSFFAIPSNMYLYSRVNMVFIKPDYSHPDRLKYPINHLRNLALGVSNTSHVFVMDADFVPSKELYTQACNDLAPAVPTDDDVDRVAMVIPCYAIVESHKDDPLPSTTQELKERIRQGIAYITDPGSGHGPTLAVPMALASYSGDDLFYQVCYESQWEPYYIVARQVAPLYDARFRNQGGDKQSHALQLNALGFKFMVSREGFILHKDHPKMVWPGGGFSQSQKAPTQWNYFEEFMREMEDLYGSNVRWPRGCTANAIGWQMQQRSPLGIVAD